MPLDHQVPRFELVERVTSPVAVTIDFASLHQAVATVALPFVRLAVAVVVLADLGDHAGLVEGPGIDLPVVVAVVSLRTITPLSPSW